MSEKKEMTNTVGVVVGNTTTDRFTFVLTSLKGSKGDIVFTESEIPSSSSKDSNVVYVWGRILSINRTNPAFPTEIAQELAKIEVEIEETLGSTGNEYQEAEVEILGVCNISDAQKEQITLKPLNYPVMPSAQVKTPDKKLVKKLLSGYQENEKLIHMGTLISRQDTSNPTHQ